MALVYPNPTVPTNGQALDATPLNANLTSIVQAIQQFDGSQIVTGSVSAAALNANINPNTLLKETTNPFIVNGIVWSIVSGLNATMSGGVMYYNGIRVTVNSVASHTFTASQDTYIDIDVNGNVTYNAVANGAAAPSLTANSNRVAKVITGASISSIVLSGFDSIGNSIYQTNPQQSIIGYNQITVDTTINTSTFSNFTGLGSTVLVPNGRSVKITLKATSIQINATDDWNLAITRDGTVLDQFIYNNNTVNFNFPVTLTFYDQTPTAGSHVYQLQGAVGVATHIMTVKANTQITPGGVGPAWILVEAQ